MPGKALFACLRRNGMSCVFSQKRISGDLSTKRARSSFHCAAGISGTNPSRVAAHKTGGLSAGFGSAYTRGCPMSCTSGAHGLTLSQPLKRIYRACLCDSSLNAKRRSREFCRNVSLDFKPLIIYGGGACRRARLHPSPRASRRPTVPE